MLVRVAQWLLLFMGLSLGLAGEAHAYIDPGTANIVLQALIGGVAAGFTVSTMYYKKIKYFLKRLFNKEKAETVRSKNSN